MISSVDNVHVRYVRSLQAKKRVRYRDRRYVAEGLRLVTHALQAGCQPAFLFVSDALLEQPAGAELLNALPDGIAAWRVTDEVLAALSDTVTPQGILAVLEMPSESPDLAAAADLILVLDAIRDPGNLGTMLRTAEAAGAALVILAPGCADPYSPKVVRAGMGAQMRLPIWGHASWQQIEAALSDKARVLADAQAPQPYWQHDWRQPTALMVGSEAHGAGGEARLLATAAVSLPMAPGVESLNAAIASAVLLFEAQRQRAANR